MIAWIVFGVLFFLAVIILLTSFVCFRMVFYSPKRKPLGPDEYEIPPGKIYEPHKENMIEWINEFRQTAHEDVEITSFDGLKLRGRYYECKAGAPIELLFNGYKGNAERDLCAGVRRCFALERNVIMINQRASGNSDGSVISFGVNERRDCISWINYAVSRFGDDAKIIIGGVSMGAATVMMAAGEELPKNVVCVMADCGYSSAREIIQKIMREMRLPVWLFYPFVKLGARIFGRFDLEETSPIEAMKKCKTPVIFIHGETDDYVPCDMSKVLYDACASKKKLVMIPGAGHGLAFPVAKEGYIQALADFQEECGF